MGNNSKKLKFHSLLKNSSTFWVLVIRNLHLKNGNVGFMARLTKVLIFDAFLVGGGVAD